MSTIRPQVVEALLDGFAGQISAIEWDVLLVDATSDEMNAAARVITETAKTRHAASRTANDLTMLQLASLASVWNIIKGWDVGHVLTKKVGDARKLLPPMSTGSSMLP
jgi:hypothetical protein